MNGGCSTQRNERNNIVIKSEVKISLLQAMEALRVARG
jgi:hypothetical protein